MKLYMHPASTTCRPVRLFAADNKIAMDEEFVDLMTGAHMQPGYAAVNPNCLVPLLEDGDLKLSESSAILKYLADKTGSPAYPKDLKARAKVNEMMDWLNTNFYRDWGYNLCYPQLFPDHEAAQRRGAGRHARASASRTPSAGSRCSTTIGSGRRTLICAATSSPSPIISAPGW